ncbi:VOC family protein [Candidatus Leptofilum sp.]|uniref:VOC family protein n=1 Tax=Candidatus Leptofilum sp. TaxID=3241576 RepID=UPI003B5CC9FD
MQKITPFLWFDNQAEEAVNLYVSIFNNSKILEMNRYGKNATFPEGTLFTARFQLEGQEFVAMNAGPQFKFTEAISLYVDCQSQAEVDALWEKLIEGGGEESQCGWLKDKFGLSWQIIPSVLIEMMNDEDLEKAQRVTNAMLQMRKIEIDKLQAAYNQT